MTIRWLPRSLISAPTGFSTRFRSPGWTEREVGRLVANTCDFEPGPGFVRSLLHETEGNPFFVEEICRHVGETGATAGAFTLAALGVPEGVKQVIARRIAHLDQSAGRVLTVAAVIGRDFELKILAEATDVDEDSCWTCWTRRAAATHRRRRPGRPLFLRPRAHPRGALRLAGLDPPGAVASTGRHGDRVAVRRRAR